MNPHSEKQQYTIVPLSGHQADSVDIHDRANAPEMIELEDIPLAAKDTPVVLLPRRTSSDSLDSVSSSQNPRKSQEPDGSPLPENTRLERDVRKIFDFIELCHARVNYHLSQSRFYGWRMGVLLGSCMSAFVLCINVGLAIYGSTTDTGYVDGIADLKFGSAAEISRWSTTFHLFINALSTMLLAASNYTMQVLSSPTRDDIDRVHRKGQWFDIGILSFRNLRRIPRQRIAMSLVLAWSSIPLHLL